MVGGRPATSPEPYFDRPRPGVGYLALLTATFVAAAAGAVMAAVSVPSLVGAIVVAVVVSLIPITALALVTRAAFATSYEIGDGRLRMRSGPFSATVRIDRVSAAERVSGLRQLAFLRSLRRTGLCNRRRDWVRVDTVDGHHYWLSPSEPERFIAALHLSPPDTGHGDDGTRG